MKGDITINSRQAKYARAFIPNYVFYIPFAYYGVVRMGTLSKFIGFSIYYILPTLYYFLYCFGYSLCGYQKLCFDYIFSRISISKLLLLLIDRAVKNFVKRLLRLH
jgi:hypothetical protein